MTVYATKIHFVNCCNNSCSIAIRVSYQVQVASRGQGVKREENRKFIIKEARTLTSGSLTGHIREAV